MAGIVKRKKTWMAIFYLNGKKMIRTTGVKIKQQGYTARQLENLARQQADKIEALARGDAMLDKQIDALRAASEAAGSGIRLSLRKISAPSWKDWRSSRLYIFHQDGSSLVRVHQTLASSD